jgi:hypothetical protein
VNLDSGSREQREGGSGGRHGYVISGERKARWCEKGEEREAGEE